MKTKSGKGSRGPHGDLQGAASTGAWSSPSAVGGRVCSGRQSGLPRSPSAVHAEAAEGLFFQSKDTQSLWLRWVLVIPG